MHKTSIRLFLAVALVTLFGCASYIPPGAKADLQALDRKSTRLNSSH